MSISIYPLLKLWPPRMNPFRSLCTTLGGVCCFAQNFRLESSKLIGLIFSHLLLGLSDFDKNVIYAPVGHLGRIQLWNAWKLSEIEGVTNSSRNVFWACGSYITRDSFTFS